MIIFLFCGQLINLLIKLKIQIKKAVFLVAFPK